MTYECKGATRDAYLRSTWSKAVKSKVRDAIGGAEFQRQKVLTNAAGNWSKEFLRTTAAGLAQVRQAACTRVKCDLFDNKRWGWECMLQLQEIEDMKTPATTTWAEEFLLRAGESREFLGS